MNEGEQAYLWMAQLLNFFQRQEQSIIGRIDGARHAINRMRNGHTSAKYRIVFNIINAVS